MVNEKENAPNINPEIGVIKPQPAEDKKQLKQFILDLTEQKIEAKFSDNNLDRENEKYQLLSGAEFSIKEVKSYIQSKARPYSPMFLISFWREMFRIFGWPENEVSVYHKRREAAIFIREVIYGRFDKGVLLSLHVLNPYTGFIRRNYKHFQFLTDDGIKKLEIVIGESEKIMKECNTYYEFRQKWFYKYGVPYQVDAFKN